MMSSKILGMNVHNSFIPKSSQIRNSPNTHDQMNVNSSAFSSGMLLSSLKECITANINTNEF